MKYAIVDLGSNTIRLSVYRILEDRSFVRLFSEKRKPQVWAVMSPTASCPEKASKKACSVLLEFRELLEQFDMKEMHVLPRRLSATFKILMKHCSLFTVTQDWK